MMDLVRRGLERVAVPGLLAATVLLPMVGVTSRLDDGWRYPHEVILVVLGWALALVMTLVAASRGAPPLSGGAGSRSRMVLIALGAWVLLRNAFVTDAVGAWAYAQTVVAFLLLGQALLDWFEGGPKRRTVAAIALALGLALQLVFVGLEAGQANFSSWLPATDSLFGDFLRNLNLVGKVTPTAYGSFGNVNFLAEWLVLVLPVVVTFLLPTKLRWGAYVLGGLGLLALFYTGCRAAVLGLVVGAPLAAFLAYGKGFWQPRKWWSDPQARRYVIASGVVVAIALGVGGQQLIYKFSDAKYWSGNLGGDWAPRMVSYVVARDMWLQQPVVGQGLGYFATRYEAQLIRSFPSQLPTNIVSSRFAETHNEPLQGLTELGVIGLVLALLAIGFWYRETSANPTLEPSQKLALLWGFSAVGVASLLGFPLHIPMTAAALLIVVAMGLARPREVAEPVQAAAWQLPYAIGAAAVVGGTGFLVLTRVVAPVVTASYVQVLGDSVMAAGDATTAADLYAVSYRLQRYKPDVLYNWMRALQEVGHFKASLDLHDAHKQEGMGEAAVVLRGRALARLGRQQEAIEAFHDVQKHYTPDQNNYKVAEQELARLQGGK